jgi:hypothetical protein
MMAIKTVVAGALGEGLEIYDFLVFSFFAVYISRAYFPQQGPTQSVVPTVATLGLGFATRPLGAYYLGMYADRFERKRVLTLTMWLMGGVLESNEYVINTVSERMAAQVQECSESFPRSVSEVAVVVFHTLPSTLVRPSRIQESRVHFECRLHRTAEFGHEGSRTHLIVGEILAVHCAEGVVSGHRVSHQAINALGRIAGRSYCRTEDKFDV